MADTPKKEDVPVQSGFKREPDGMSKGNLFDDPLMRAVDLHGPGVLDGTYPVRRNETDSS